MSNVLGILGALAFIVGVLVLFTARTSEQQLWGLVFWLIAVVFFVGETIAYATRAREDLRSKG